MSENNIVTGETVESVEMHDGQDWGDSVDDASGTPSQILPSENATPVLFTPESSSESEDDGKTRTCIDFADADL